VRAGEPDGARAPGSTVAPPLMSGRRPLLLAQLVANGTGQAAAAIGAALLVESTFNRIVEGGSQAGSGSVAPLGAALAGTAIVLGALRARERSDAERLGQSYVHDLRSTMYRRLSSLAPRALQHRSQGAVMLRFVGDLTVIGRWVSLGLSRLIVGSIFVAGVVAALAVISPRLAAGVAIVLAVAAALALQSSRTLRERSRAARRRRARLAANVNEKVGAIGVVQAFGQTRRERRRLDKQSNRLRDAMVERAKTIGLLRGLSEGTALLATAAVLMVGAAEVAAGRATPGTVVAAMAIVGLLANPLRDLGRVNEYWHNSRISLEKVRSFLLTPNVVRETRGAPPLAPGPGRLEFRDATVDGALQSVSAVAEPGSVIALVGPNGAGKSTLLDLGARLLDPDGGAVLLDGQDLSLHQRRSIRDAVSIAGPDFPLLRGTVADNLRYRWPDAPDEELERVGDMCGLDALLADLPHGAETRVIEGGRNLSAGQRQRIALARALVGGPRLLLLDEADANLDPDARALVARIVRAQRGRRTVLVVSHRPEVTRAADFVWRLDDGRLTVEPSVAPSGASGEQRS
jgi:ABC-type multidrug transport system fused ATPase/permease subunit